MILHKDRIPISSSYIIILSIILNYYSLLLLNIRACRQSKLAVYFSVIQSTRKISPVCVYFNPTTALFNSQTNWKVNTNFMIHLFFPVKLCIHVATHRLINPNWYLHSFKFISIWNKANVEYGLVFAIVPHERVLDIDCCSRMSHFHNI